MKIDYIVYGDAFSADGVTAKIAGQVRRWKDAGHTVRTIFVSYASPDGSLPALDADIFPFTGAAGRVRATVAAARDVRRHRPDLVYMRYDWFSPPLVPLLAPTPTIVELNTDERVEGRLYGRAIASYNRVHWLATIPLAAGFVTVTREILATLGGHADGRPATVIANGVDLPTVPDPPQAPLDGTRLVMLVGSRPPPPWHGLDRLEELARSAPDVAIDLIGVGSDHELGALPNVSVHPRLTREQYAPLLSRATAAVGPLAIYRTNLNEASPLKVREYLAHGLPVLTSHRDTDFPGEPWFLHRVPNRDCSLAGEIRAITRWLESVRGRRVARADVGHLSADVKERARLAFFEHVLSHGGRRLAR